MKKLIKLFCLGIGLTFIIAITSGIIIAEDNLDVSTTSPQIASIMTRVTNSANASLSGIEFRCTESNSAGSVLNTLNFTTNNNGTFVWETVVNENFNYSCTAISGFPPCYVPPSTSQQTFTITDLVAGQIRSNTLVWVFEPSQIYRGSTCGDYLNPVEPGETPAEISTISIPSGYVVSPFLGNLSVQDAQSVRDLTITYIGSDSSFSCSSLSANNSVQWLRRVNLNDPAVIDVFRNLPKHITLDMKGSIMLDVNNVPELNKSRRLYLNNLNLNSENSNVATILIDNIEANRDMISNISYTNSTLSFVVERGTTFEFVPTISVDQCSTRALRSGECSFSGRVDALCSSLVLEVSDNDKTDTYNIDLEQDGTFQYQVSDLNPDSLYEFKLIATVHNNQSNYYIWGISDFSGIFSGNLLLIIGVIVVIALVIVYIINKKKKEKELLERRETLSNNIKKLVTSINRFTNEIKDRYKKIDLNNNRHVSKAVEILKLNEIAKELKNYVKESEKKELEEKVPYPIDEIEMKYFKLHNRFEKFKKALIEEAAIKTVSSKEK